MRYDEVSSAAVILHEYERLKEEQLQRISTRDNLVYATLASIGAVLFGVHQVGAVDLVLLLPPGCVALGWTYLVNDEKISAVGRYVRAELAPRLARMPEVGEPVFGWETFHRSDARRRSRKLIQLAVDVLIFCVPGVVAIAVRLAAGEISFLAGLVVVAEITMVLFLVQQIVVNADLHRDGPRSAADDNAPAFASFRSGRGTQ
ncbi:hypothetical protein [Catenuloplanes atrovinosus]|uniref:Integral membrane protein n=1 Tax=Catenuloplanes atrovinosus TaxID=137266 RepID=A0AAE4C908_9ACTN|nr:hypothetical protein [Catenuloplanes atrovinosus]MDR7274334.1 hypothetical protein [Catenuloplanes atrovinosus]